MTYKLILACFTTLSIVSLFKAYTVGSEEVNQPDFAQVSIGPNVVKVELVETALAEVMLAEVVVIHEIDWPNEQGATGVMERVSLEFMRLTEVFWIGVCCC